ADGQTRSSRLWLAGERCDEIVEGGLGADRGADAQRDGVAVLAQRHLQEGAAVRLGGDDGRQAPAAIGVRAEAQDRKASPPVDARVLLSTADDGSPAFAQIRELATRKLPEVDALITRAQAMRAWLQTATGCNCATLDVCALFDDQAPDEPTRADAALSITRVARREEPSAATRSGRAGATR